MTIQHISNANGDFACSMYGPEWAGPDGDRLTLALALLKHLGSGKVQLHSFENHLVFQPSVGISEIIESATDWNIAEDSGMYLHAHADLFLVAMSTSSEEPVWPQFDSIEYSKEMKNELEVQWKKEISGVSQGAYVSQSQHMISTPSRLGLLAQQHQEHLVWPPRQLNEDGERIETATTKLSESATILTWTRLSPAGAPSEFSERAPILDGVATVLVAFDQGPKGVFMLADDEKGTPSIGDRVCFEIRRLYGQDEMIHYGLKARLLNS